MLLLLTAPVARDLADLPPLTALDVQAHLDLDNALVLLVVQPMTGASASKDLAASGEPHRMSVTFAAFANAVTAGTWLAALKTKIQNTLGVSIQ